MNSIVKISEIKKMKRLYIVEKEVLLWMVMQGLDV